jgi:CrcB protein
MKKNLVVALGGIVGSVVRWSLGLWIVDHGFPWATLLVNLTGSAILLFVLEWSELHPYEKWWWRPLFATGFCGGYTTYSAFAVKLVQYIEAHKYFYFLTYSTVTLIGTFVILAFINRVLIQSEKIHQRIVKNHGHSKRVRQVQP